MSARLHQVFKWQRQPLPLTGAAAETPRRKRVRLRALDNAIGAVAALVSGLIFALALAAIVWGLVVLARDLVG